MPHSLRMPGLAKSHTVNLMDLSAERGEEADAAASGAACFRILSYIGSNSSHRAAATAFFLPKHTTFLETPCGTYSCTVRKHLQDQPVSICLQILNLSTHWCQGELAF